MIKSMKVAAIAALAATGAMVNVASAATTTWTSATVTENLSIVLTAETQGATNVTTSTVKKTGVVTTNNTVKLIPAQLAAKNVALALLPTATSKQPTLQKITLYTNISGVVSPVSWTIQVMDGKTLVTNNFANNFSIGTGSTEVHSAKYTTVGTGTNTITIGTNSAAPGTNYTTNTMVNNGVTVVTVVTNVPATTNTNTVVSYTTTTTYSAKVSDTTGYFYLSPLGTNTLPVTLSLNGMVTKTLAVRSIPKMTPSIDEVTEAWTVGGQENTTNIVQGTIKTTFVSVKAVTQ